MTQIVGLASLAEYAGVHAATVRRAIKDGSLAATRSSLGHWQVEEAVLKEYLATRPLPKTEKARVEARDEAQGTEMGIAVRVLENALLASNRTCEDLRTELHASRAELREAHGEIRKLEAEMRALLQGALGATPSRWVRTEEPSRTPDPTSPAVEPEQVQAAPQPEATAFKENCLRLMREGRSDEEIAKELRKSKAIVMATLRKHRHI